MRRGFVSVIIIVLMAYVSPTAARAAAPIIGPKPQTVEDMLIPAPRDISVGNWITGLEAPWSLVFLTDGRALVSERPGRIRLIRDGKLAAEPYAVFETTRGQVVLAISF